MPNQDAAYIPKLQASDSVETHRALNNMLFLIEKYIDTPIEGLPKYDPYKDPSAGSGYIYANQ